MKQTRIYIATIITLLGAAGAQQTTDPLNVLLQSNREIKAAREAYLAMKERINTEGVLPDPMLESSFFLAPVETRNGPMEGQLMLGQKFPLWGKLSRKRQIAVLDAENSLLMFRIKEIVSVYKMRKLWANRVKLEKSLKILNGYRSELESFRSIALTQYSTGTGLTQHPILKLQIEKSIVESRINTMESSLQTVENELQALFDGQFTPELFGENWQLDIENRSEDRRLKLAKRVNPGYLKVQNDLKIAELKNELAIKANYPDLVTGFTYTVIGNPDDSMTPKPGGDALGFKIGLNLPLWFTRNKARVESTSLLVKSREETRQDVWNHVEEGVLSTLKQLREIEETYHLYDTKLAQESEQMLSSAFSAYETGKISFLDLLDSERMVINVRLDFEKVKAEKQIAIAQLLKDIGMIRFEEESRNDKK